MSKKLIAVAAAAALALTGLVGISPANAAVVVTFSTNSADNTTGTAFTPAASASAAAANIVVPADNKLTYTNSTERSSLARVVVDTAVGDTVTATSTGALKILDLNGVGAIGSDFRAETTAGTDYTSTAGTQSFSMVATTTSVVFYVFTTSTTAASLTVNKGGNTRIVWIKGAAGPAYNLTSTMPSVIPASAPSTANLIVKITDVFGNEVKAQTGLTTSATGGGATITATGNADHSSTLGGYGLSLHATGTGGFAVSVSFTSAPVDVTGLPKAVKLWFAQSTAVDLAGLQTQVTALTAQVAALTAQLASSRPKATSVTKKKYNTLARKWNAANPGARVALKK
jgi:hypothetical protein